MGHQQPRPYFQPDLTQRLTTVEANQQSLSVEVQNVGKRMDHLADATTRAMQDLGNRFAESRQTPWATLSGWAAVVIMVAGVGFNIMRSNEDKLNAHLQQPGHPASLENQKSMRELISSNDEKINARLDRQMLAAEALTAKFDTALQREMRDLDSAGYRYMEQLEKRLERLEARIDRSNGSGAGH